jgi:hypothetical protein
MSDVLVISVCSQSGDSPLEDVEKVVINPGRFSQIWL